jgi:hypothetical protein
MVKMKPRHGQSWLPEEDRELKERFLANASIQELSERHQRGTGAIRSRLRKLGLIEAGDHQETQRSVRELDHLAQSGSETSKEWSRSTCVSDQVGLEEDARRRRLLESIDALVERLDVLKTAISVGHEPSRQAIRDAMLAFNRFDAELLAVVLGQYAPDDQEDDSDPLPDRLRNALTRIVRVCVIDQKDRHVAIKALGLSGDGEHVTLSQIGDELGVTRERARQRRVRAFRKIHAAIPRRIASCASLRTVLGKISAETDWTDPSKVAPWIITLVTDRFSALEQLTLICCRAAGCSIPLKQLMLKVKQTVTIVCRAPSIIGDWRADTWKNAAQKVVFAGGVTTFNTAPHEIVGLKRRPGGISVDEAIFFKSEKLGRHIACESVTEYRVVSWLEDAPEVVWYQEQPAVVAYKLDGRPRRHFPDIAILDRQGRLSILEVKPVFHMYRVETLIRASASLAHFGQRGMGYLVIDATGRTLSDHACVPYDLAIAQEIEALIAKSGAIPFRAVRQAFANASRRLDVAQFISMVVNRDWSVTQVGPVSISRLPEGVSFQCLLPVKT